VEIFILVKQFTTKYVSPHAISYHLQKKKKRKAAPSDTKENNWIGTGGVLR
jgi:hypothetical protein